jgi:hypothetical protein
VSGVNDLPASIAAACARRLKVFSSASAASAFSLETAGRCDLSVSSLTSFSSVTIASFAFASLASTSATERFALFDDGDALVDRLAVSFLRLGVLVPLVGQFFEFHDLPFGNEKTARRRLVCGCDAGISVGGRWCGFDARSERLREQTLLVGLTPTGQGLETGNEARRIRLGKPAYVAKEGFRFGNDLMPSIALLTELICAAGLAGNVTTDTSQRSTFLSVRMPVTRSNESSRVTKPIDRPLTALAS